MTDQAPPHAVAESHPCSQCGAGAIVNDDSVRIDLRYVKSDTDLTPKLKHHGWQFKVFQGRPAIYRYLCIPCLIALDEAANCWSEIRQQAREVDAITTTDDFYRHLCS